MEHFSPIFTPRGTTAEVEGGTAFQPNFDANGLIVGRTYPVGEGVAQIERAVKAAGLADR